MTSSSESRFPLKAEDYELLEKIGDGLHRARCIVLDEIVLVNILDLEKCRNDLETIRNQVHPRCCSFLVGRSLWIVIPIGKEDSASDNSDKLKNEAEIPTSPVNPLSGGAAKIIPLLQNLLLNNESQRKTLIGLIQLCDTTAADKINPISNTEAARQISTTETDLEVHFLQQSVKKLEDEIEYQKKANAQLEDLINRLTKSSVS